MPVTAAVILGDRPSGRIRPQLDSLRRALVAHAEPQRNFPSILVVGTNGKGSTAAMLEAVLRAHGLKTGLFTSPHLMRVTERVIWQAVEGCQLAYNGWTARKEVRDRPLRALGGQRSSGALTLRTEEESVTLRRADPHDSASLAHKRTPSLAHL